MSESVKTVYTFGYQGQQPYQLLQALERMGAVLFDIRYSARSRIHCWNGDVLAKTFGERYRYVPELGNINYRGGPIQIANLEKGIEKVLLEERPVVLMCVCSDYGTCHRRVVAEALQTRGIETKELRL